MKSDEMDELTKDLERLNIEENVGEEQRERETAMRERAEFRKLDAQLEAYMRELENDLQEESKEDPIEARLR